ncbi:MAG: tetratricopeptide repeat protein [Pseudomonadota bacterium]
MAVDQFGLDLSLATDAAPKAAGHWDATVRAFLAHGAETPVHLGNALDAATHFPLAQACRGLFMLLLGRRELVQTAREAYQTVTTAAAELGVSAREQAYIDALGDWLGGHPLKAADRLDRCLCANPRDAMALKVIHGIRFIMGDQPGMRRSIESVIDHYDANHPASGYVQGCYAFALEETGDQTRAEEFGRLALDRAPDDAWGLHAVAHVMEMQGRAEDGIGWVRSNEDAWTHCNNFRFHVVWHLALFHLDQRDFARVLELYDTEIRAEKTDDYRDFSNAASLLSRLELEGVDTGNRWAELIEIAENRIDDGSVVFADLHYLLALCQESGRGLAMTPYSGAENLVSRMRKSSMTCASDMARVAGAPGLDAAKGVAAFGCGNFAAAHAAFQRAVPDLIAIGGSHAQRDVFIRLAIEAAIRCKSLDAAETLIRNRTTLRGADDDFSRSRMSHIGDMRARSASRPTVNPLDYAVAVY